MIRDFEQLSSWDIPKKCGRVIKVLGSVIEATGIQGFIGEVCYIHGKTEVLTTIIYGFFEKTVFLMPVTIPLSITPGFIVYPTGLPYHIQVDRSLCGRIINSLGKPLDGKGEIKGKKRFINNQPPQPLDRTLIRSTFSTGIKVIDAFCTMGRGQKIGIFSEPGYGKSTLLAQLAKNEESDINVIALIGERGREAKEFIQKLGDCLLKKSILILSTSDETPASKIIAADTAMSIAEYFRDEKLNVLLIMDSLSRYEQALKELAICSGEGSNSSLYPSVNLSLARFLERVGALENGSITAIFSALSNGEGMDINPYRLHSLLDGHIILSNPLERIFEYPAVNIINSLSRIMPSVTSQSHMKSAEYFKKLVKIYLDSQDLINLGAYTKGINPLLDTALQKMSTLQTFMKQKFEETHAFDNTIRELEKLAAE